MGGGKGGHGRREGVKRRKRAAGEERREGRAREGSQSVHLSRLLQLEEGAVELVHGDDGPARSERKWRMGIDEW
eukprot:6143738-Pleurochrysis_carterae.AAC.1